MSARARDRSLRRPGILLSKANRGKWPLWWDRVYTGTGGPLDTNLDLS
jgi:hypothetical protein